MLFTDFSRPLGTLSVAVVFVIAAETAVLSEFLLLLSFIVLVNLKMSFGLFTNRVCMCTLI